MLPFVGLALFAGTSLFSVASAQGDPKLTGTWSTKSNKVFTGPGFYDPVTEQMFEPALTGISYSFTDDGHYEEALYRAIANPQNPKCPSAIMQFQHGTFQIGSNGSLTLNPYSVDGRQLLSQPCEFQNSILTRYNQTEFFQRYDPYIDPYHNIMRLDLYQFDGSPANPMYLVYKPPQMLPTQTLNPTTTSSAPGSTSTANSKLRRSLSGLPGSIDDSTISRRKHAVNADRWWWIGVGMTAIGGVGYFCF